MQLAPAIVCAAALAFSTLGASAGPPVADAAKKFYPSATWQEASVRKGDFSCGGKQEIAILGTSKTEIVVAVFLQGLAKKPETLRYSTSNRSPESAVLPTEDLNFNVKTSSARSVLFRMAFAPRRHASV